MPAANPETPNSTSSRETSTQSSSAAVSQGYVLPEGRIMPNTVFVGGIDDRMDATEIKSCFGRYGSVKEVKIITDRTGVSKGYGFVSFFNDVDVQKIVESQIHIQGKKLKLGPAIRKQNLCAYRVQPRRLVFNPPPPPQFQNVWSNPNAETYLQPRVALNPITQYVQAYPSYPNSPGQGITGYQLPVYNYQMPPQWPVGEPRNYAVPLAYPTYPNSPGQVIAGYHLPVCNYQPAANPETPNSTSSRETSTQSSSAAVSQGYVLPEGRIMPNTVFVGGIDDRMDATEIKSCFGRYGSVKEVKIITDRTGVSKGYGFVSFFNDVDVQKIVESQIHIQGKKLKLGPAIRKQNLCAYRVQPRRLVFNPPPPPQFQNVWSNPNAETYLQPRVALNPITQYVQAYPAYPHSPCQVITEYQVPVYYYQIPPQWPIGETRSYAIPLAYPTYRNSPCQVITGYQLPVYNYQMPPQWPVGEPWSYAVPLAYPTYRNSPCQVITGYQLPVYNYQMPPQWLVGEPRSYAVPLAYPIYRNSPCQVITGYHFPVYYYPIPPQWPVGQPRSYAVPLAYPTYRNSPCQVITGYHFPVYYYAMPPQWPVGEPRNYTVPLAYPTYRNSSWQVITGHHLPVYNYQIPLRWPVGEQRSYVVPLAYPTYPDPPVQVITGHQLPVYNYQMPPQWPVGDQRRRILLIQVHQVRSSLDISCLYIIIRNLWTEAYKRWYLVCLIKRTD
ncbi:deleted in azoospermia protein 4-like isoform X22 [Macaca thibetana thibetana]|uniref:deleted in azoospermia protein 4-like isoform X21 n=1 Tax=Macaca thibetana thibetana TaxID=257877 RepID=UPI0021BC5C7A|nr:deleted in azoospermia protein 4-like isoform X21 [Macaca thibetana thibetana]XP_050633814.1 deleted in azoospermia protein 4-like isoform X22 [Macaca thibetana thibetana]